MTEQAAARARERVAQIALAPLILAVLVAAVMCKWHTPFCVDNRTYVEMIDGVAHHGLPYASNGRADLFPELQMRWLEYHRGHLWGSYPPVYAYFAAPFYRVGGLRLVTQVNIALLAVLALGVYALTRRLVERPLAATVAAYLILAATHVWTFSFDVSPYTLMIAAGTWSLFFAVRALQVDVHARRNAAISGFLAMFAAGAHLLSLPLVACVVLTLFLFRRPEEPVLLPAFAERLPLQAWLPSRESIVRGVAATAGVLVVLVPIAALNRYRFGAWSPLGGGSCVWRSCTEGGLSQQGIGTLLRDNAPFLVWLGVVVTTVLALRASRGAVVAVWLIAVCALLPPSRLHNAAINIFTMGTAFVLDLSWLNMGFWKPPDGFGNLLGPYLVKSMLQSAPLLLVAAAVRYGDIARRREAWIVGLPVIALLTSLVLRGNIPPLYALGFPYLDLRYVTPALPLLTVLAVVAVREFPWSRWHLVGLALLGAAFWRWNSHAPNDIPLFRRVVVLRVSLVLAALAFVFVLRAVQTRSAWRQHLAMALCIAAAAFGIGLDLGIDLRAWQNDRNSHDTFSDHVATLMPHRFGLLGLAGPFGIDAVLALRPTHDIEYADVGEARGGFPGFRGLVEHWTAESRPIYVIMPDPFISPWPDFRIRVVDREFHLYQLVPNT